MQENVTPQDYDENIINQGLQFQIDNYYFPKDASMKYRIEIVLRHLNPAVNEKVLDLGCGVGTFAYQCAKKGAKAWGLDYSEESIKTAKNICGKYGVIENTRFIIHDISNELPFNDAYFNKIIASDFIEHITREQKIAMLNEMKRVLKPEGIIIIFTPNKIREDIGAFKRKIQRLFKIDAKETRLHFGLINRFKYEKMIKQAGLKYKRYFYDINNPFLSKIIILKELFALNLLWEIKKR